MRFDIITIFPEFFSGPLDYGIVRRAREARLIETHVHDLRNFTHDRHRTVDDRPFGGGEGMVMKPEPFFEAVESLVGSGSAAPSTSTAVVLLSAAGKLFGQEAARRFARSNGLFCCAAATKAWTSASRNISPRTKFPSEISFSPEANSPPP